MNKNNSNIAFLSDSLLSGKLKEPKHGKRFLKFAIEKNMTGLIPLEDLQGTIKVFLKDILPVPQVPEYWRGITNLQGEAIWMLDFLQFLGGQNLCSNDSFTSANASWEEIAGMAMLIKIEQQTIGLLVERIKGIEVYDPDLCLPMTKLNSTTNLKFIFKHYFLDYQNKPAMLLDINSLILMLQDC